ncbi:hypothetical protein HJG60_011326 [Phyllostomus discolor]|uniref:Uncharacterized protein n=1 Tax=Phyllostomus discolor TaxID=89673 RepID=A0A833ZWN5_9CHIR|nr:hypothetical protein HJG60_011326 [Phyllostomus discolor]
MCSINIVLILIGSIKQLERKNFYSSLKMKALGIQNRKTPFLFPRDTQCDRRDKGIKLTRADASVLVCFHSWCYLLHIPVVTKAKEHINSHEQDLVINQEEPVSSLMVWFWPKCCLSTLKKTGPSLGWMCKVMERRTRPDLFPLSSEWFF